MPTSKMSNDRPDTPSLLSSPPPPLSSSPDRPDATAEVVVGDEKISKTAAITTKVFAVLSGTDHTTTTQKNSPSALDPLTQGTISVSASSLSSVSPSMEDEKFAKSFTRRVSLPNHDQVGQVRIIADEKVRNENESPENQAKKRKRCSVLIGDSHGGVSEETTQSSLSQENPHKDLYLGLSGWKELEDGLPLILCTMRQSMPREINNDASAWSIDDGDEDDSSIVELPVAKKRRKPSSTSKKVVKSGSKQKGKGKAAKTKTSRSLALSLVKKAIHDQSNKKTKKTREGLTPWSPGTSQSSDTASQQQQDHHPPSRKKSPASSSNVRESMFTPFLEGRPGSKKAKPVKEFPISVLRETDVLSGRGSNVCVFPGNILFRNYINDLRDEYQTAQRKQKMVIATRVCNLVLDSGGRFLEKHESPNVYAWKLLPHDKVLEKCSQALREKNRWSAVKGK